MRIPANIIEDIRNSADIAEIVSGYVSLKKRGQNHFGICPFHTEKTPSFSINQQKQIFHCFGFGEGGNAISFIMKIENISFTDSVRFLAQKMNIEIPESNEDETSKKVILELYDLTKFAAKYYHDQLWGEIGNDAKNYLLERSFSDTVLHQFEVGYAPEGWDNLIKAALKFGFTNNQLKTVGLIVPNNRGGYYDRFRDRIMFPIHNLSGLVVGFGGRIFKDVPDAPKYINSPETAIYRKSKILFGLFQSREAIRKDENAILVEGYADVLGLVQSGVQNVVATSGTALTQEQAQLLLRHTPNVNILYDGDLAGANAALRGIDILMHQGLHVKVAELPEGTDPDSFVKTRGADSLRKKIDDAKELIDFKIYAFTSNKPANTPQRKAELVYILAESIAEIRDEVAKNLYIQDVAKRLGVAENIIFKAVAKKRRQVRKLESDEPQPKEPISGRMHAERDLLEILLRYPHIIPSVYKSLEVTEIRDQKNRVILEQIYEQFVKTGKINQQHVLDFVEAPGMQNFIVNVMMKEADDEPNESLKQWTSDCIRLIKIGNLQQKIQTAREAIRQHLGDGTKLRELNEQYHHLKQIELELKRKEFIVTENE